MRRALVAARGSDGAEPRELLHSLLFDHLSRLKAFDVGSVSGALNAAKLRKIRHRCARDFSRLFNAR